jgi:predicted ArsR family transcriptional regulator
MSTNSEPSEVRLDRRSVRVLAHPLRNRLLTELRREGPASATDLARRLDTNTGATSYHLRKLAEVGLVEEAAGGVGRERRWRAAHEFTTLSLRDVQGDPDAEAALAWLHGEFFQQFTDKARLWAEAQSGWSLEWREASGASDSMLELTPAELSAMQDEIWEVAERYRTVARARAAEDGDEAEDRHRVFFFMHCFPDTEEQR